MEPQEAVPGEARDALDSHRRGGTRAFVSSGRAVGVVEERDRATACAAPAPWQGHTWEEP